MQHGGKGITTPQVVIIVNNVRVFGLLGQLSCRGL
jgi:hypothetical protein